MITLSLALARPSVLTITLFVLYLYLAYISRFRSDDPGGQTVSEESFDYRHVPLMDTEEDQQKGLYDNANP